MGLDKLCLAQLWDDQDSQKRLSGQMVLERTSKQHSALLGGPLEAQRPTSGARWSELGLRVIFWH